MNTLSPHRQVMLLLLLALNTCVGKIVVNTWAGPFTAATASAFDMLSNGGNCLDAVETGCTTCEVNQCDGSVGYGNHPDTSGDVTLDAMIMDGNTMDVGAVAFMSKFRSAATVARRVMEYTTHTMLVGEGAEEFAKMIGVPPQHTVTNESLQIFKSWEENNCQPNFYQNLDGCDDSCGPYPAPVTSHATSNNLTVTSSVARKISRSHVPWASEKMHDTIGLVVVDGAGQMACGTTTNGASHKVRGRVGDSPIPGSGCYVNTSVGGCAATGDGDVMMRFSPTFAGVMYMSMGMSPNDASIRALQPIINAFPTFSGGVVCLNNNEEYGAATYNMGFQISVMADGMDEVLTVDVSSISE